MFISCQLCFPQAEMDSVEMRLISLRQDYLDSAYNFDDYSYNLSDKFLTELKHDLVKYPETFDYKFDSLKTMMNIVISEDSLVKIYSWLQTIGGTWHDLQSVVQFKTGTGIDTISLNTNKEAEVGGYTDASYGKIQILKAKSRKIYLITGWGTHGSGQHHKIIRAFTIENNRFVEEDSLFDGKQNIVIEAPRSEDIKLVYDSKDKTITYNLYQWNDDIGYYEATDKNAILMWNGKKFVRQ